MNFEAPKATIIERNGQSVNCYGEWEEDSNCMCVFEDERFDGIWCDGASSWEGAVSKLTAYAKRKGTVLLELQAC